MDAMVTYASHSLDLAHVYGSHPSLIRGLHSDLLAWMLAAGL